ncbi:MAG: site-2 protease family protein [Archaeoglobaceae archaeon]|nr:site-2 protease family protein [Archaeoglobaceae archaeon]MCX8152399.1 site-2 protease family protein [Archaeoglobaceae archaeon]MDW8013739.1 site-2 protease family protein [Archaeoglobaceae archaeon]
MDDIEKFFKVYLIEKIKNGYRYYVVPTSSEEEIRKFLAVLSNEKDVKIKYKKGEIVLEVKKRKQNYFLNLILLAATIVSTTFAGMLFYPEPNLLGGLVFSASIMFVLGSHEMGHYFAARKWKMKTSLPYFIPFPSIVGTLGAVIKHSGVVPNRKALFDVAVSGPLAGILAAIVVTYIGAKIPFEVDEEPTILIGIPIIFELVLLLAGFQSFFIHPVAFAGWVGFFVTFLNLLPVGQLDGGHVARAMIGKRAEVVSKIFPFTILLLAIYLDLKGFQSDIWLFWAIFVFFMSLTPHPEILDDSKRLDLKRSLLGSVVFFLAILCFTPVPITFYK